MEFSSFVAYDRIHMKWIEKSIEVGPFLCNCKLIVCPKSLKGVLIDPGDDWPSIEKLIHETEKELGKNISIESLYHTHAHLDHVGATKKAKEYCAERSQNGSIYLHPKDEIIYQNLKLQGQMFGHPQDDPLPIDQYFEDEQELQVGELKFKIYHTPGHSPGGVCLELSEDSVVGIPQTLYSGDTLFQGSIGRTDLWEGNTDQLLSSIRTRIFTLDDEIRVCPGHGPSTTVGIEKRQNPFFR